MKRARGVRQTRHIRPGVSKDEVYAFLDSVFTALWTRVDGTSMIDMLGGDPLTLSSDPGTTDIPGGYAGTITAPSDAGLIAADVNDVLYTVGVANALSVSDFIDADLERIPVKYDDATPYDIQMIGIYDPTVYAGLTDADKIKISNYMDLWVFYWGAWIDAGSVEKDNRTFGEAVDKSMMDTGKGTFDDGTVEGWFAYGTNTLANVSNALQITYVDSALGTYTEMRAFRDLAVDLTIGETYKVMIRAKDNVGGNHTRLFVGGFGVNAYSDWLTTDFQWVEIDFTALNATGHTFRCDSMASGDIVTIDEWYIYKP